MTGTVPFDRRRGWSGGTTLSLLLCAAMVGGLAAWAVLLPFGTLSPLLVALAGAVSGGIVLTAASRWQEALRADHEPYLAQAERRKAEDDRSLPPPAPGEAAAAPPPSPPSGPDRDEERRVAKIERMDAMGRLAGGFAHDFNNLMGAIAGYADFLVSDLPPDSAQADYAARILRTTERGKEMLRRLTAFARSGAPELRPTGTARLFAEVLARISPDLPSSITLTVREETDLPDLLANAPLLIHAVVSLAATSCEVLTARGAPEEGRLTLRVTPWPRQDQGPDRGPEPSGEGYPPGWAVYEALPPRPRPHVLFEVRDNGPGLPETQLAQLFEPFRPGAGKDSGLELAVVLGIVRGHDGGLAVCSREGEGTAFRLFVPVVAAPAAQATAAMEPPSGPPVHRCRILVVDDEPTMGDLMSAGLERFGHETAVCESADEALEVFDEEPGAFDVVIADQSMPGMSGMTLIARLKARRPDLVCVLYTGNSRVATDARAWAAGADAFFAKPVDIAEVARRVAALAATRRASRCDGAGP